jgi:hypothetical protein
MWSLLVCLEHLFGIFEVYLGYLKLMAAFASLFFAEIF